MNDEQQAPPAAPTFGDPMTVSVPGNANMPGATVTFSPDAVRAFQQQDPAARAAGEAEVDAGIIDALPADASAYRPPEWRPGDPRLDVGQIREWQSLAHELGVNPGPEFSTLWRGMMDHDRRNPGGMDDGSLALAARATLANCERMWGAERLSAVKANADRALATVHRRSPEGARRLRDAAVTNPLMLHALGDVGRRLQVRATRRK